MALTSETMAGLRLLVCMAKADGVLKGDERFAIEEALAGVTLPEGLTLERLLEEINDPVRLAAEITSADARDYTYASVFSLAYCDSDLDVAEEKLLKLLRETWKIDATDQQKLAEALETSTRLPAVGTIARAAVTDEKQRRADFDALLIRNSFLAGVTGGIRVALLSDMQVTPIQVRVLNEVAALFGQTLEQSTVTQIFEALALGGGARIGISALLKLVPGWGTTVGAESAFVNTHALGNTAWDFFQNGGKMHADSLKPVFRKYQAAAKTVYAGHKEAIEAAEDAHGDKLKQLSYDLQQGKISQKQYEEQIDAL